MKGLFPAIAVVAALGCAGVDAQVDRILADAQVELRRGQLAAAREFVDRGEHLTRAKPDSLAAWKVRLLKTEVAIAGLEFAEALKHLEAAVPPGESFTLVRARQQYHQAQVQLARGQLQPALTSLDDARAIAGGDPDLLLDIEVLGSQARLRLGQWDDAEQRLNGVLKAANGRADRFREALAINNLGMSRLIRNRFDDALPWFERVLAYDDLQQTRVYAASLNNAGICLARLGQFDRALALQGQAVAMYERSGRKNELMTALGEIGTTHLLRNDLAQALPHLERALTIARDAGMAADGSVWARNLAAAHVALGNWDDAARYNDEARRLNPPSRAGKLVLNTATEAQIASARGRRSEAEKLFQQVLANAASEPSMRWVAHEGLAHLAVEAKDARSAASHFEAALDTIEKTRSALLKTDYRLSFLTRLIHFYQAYVDHLVDAGRTERALEVADSSRGRVLAERLGVAAPSRGSAASFVRRARDTGQVFVVYWLAPQRSLAWVVTGGGVRTFHLAPRADIEPLVERQHALIQNTLEDPLAVAGGPAEQLYARLVAPIADAIAIGGKVVIVPDGALHRLNFETLVTRTGGPARYWIEDVTIQVAPSLSTMSTWSPRSTVAAGSLLMVGDPTPRPPDFPTLTYAAAEIEGVTRHFDRGSVTILRSAAATPGGFRDARPERFAAIHFTSHAVANPESPMDSAVILSGPDSAYKLYARDVAEMPLGAEVVVVSACRSAGDKAYAGEGLVGFAWAFLRAGSRRVIAGLWDVDDRSTAALMERYYSLAIDGGAGPAAALRNAKLTLVRQQVRPYYWAPLQMFTVSP